MASAMASATECPARRTVAPYPSVAAIFGSGALLGITTVALAPSSDAANATPWPVVAGTGRDHPGRPLFRSESGDADVGAADLERAAPLQVLALLELDAAAAPGGEHPGADHRGDSGPRR